MTASSLFKFTPTAVAQLLNESQRSSKRAFNAVAVSEVSLLCWGWARRAVEVGGALPDIAGDEMHLDWGRVSWVALSKVR